MDELRSTDDVAAELGIDPSRVRRLAARYGIGRKLGPRAWVFGPADVAAMRARSSGPRKPGRPPKRPDADPSPPDAV